MNNFKTIIGLEIHAQLNTKSKMFCSCSNDAEGQAPNTLVCPICLGLPGTLPVANNQAIEHVCKIGLALSSSIAKLSWFDRKHYFYPDLPKGYQISQFQKPFCEGGELEVDGKKVRINRVHLEEDAGKLVHLKGNKSYVDLNRAGTPLAEIVTEPDIESPAQAKEFMKELRELLRSIGVSDADMEKGHLRCDANISITANGHAELGSASGSRNEFGMTGGITETTGGAISSPIVEIKNLNSFKFVEKALEIEEKRLKEDFDGWPERQTKVTRGFDSKNNRTYQLREKEESKDYRYFPEPDIPPIELHKLFDLEKIKQEMNKLPQASKQELILLGLSNDDINTILKNSEISKLVELAEDQDKVVIGKLLINNPLARKLNVEQLKEIADLIRRGHPSNWVRDMIKQSVERKKLPSEIVGEMQEAPSEGAVERGMVDLVTHLIEQNQDAVKKYKSGNTGILQFFIGQAMKITEGFVNPKELKEELIKQLEA